MSKRSSKGEGTIYKRADGLWVAQITLPTGKRKSKYSKKQKVVREWLLKQREAIRDGIWVENDNLLVSQYLDRYLNDIVAPTVRPKTFESYESIMRVHVNPAIGNIRLTRLRPDHLQALYTKKREEGYSERTVQYIHSVIRQSLNQALKWGLVARNVTDLVEAPRPQRRTPTTFTPEQAKLFLETIKGERLYPLYVLAITTGMRKGELLGLMWDDVDLDWGMIHVRHSAQRIWKKGIIITEPKSESSRRTILLSDTTKDMLTEYKKDRFSDLVFPSPTGNPMSGSNLRKHFNETLEKAGLPKIRFHDLRHTSATLLLIAGVHPKIVQERLGHSRISETLDTYYHVIPSMQQDAADKMSDILS